MILLVIGTISYATANDMQIYYKCQEEVKGKKFSAYVHVYDLNEYQKALTTTEGRTATCSDEDAVLLTHRGAKIMQQRAKLLMID